jgi:hypothetical protein
MQIIFGRQTLSLIYPRASLHQEFMFRNIMYVFQGTVSRDEYFFLRL